MPVCRFYLQGNCRYGPACRNSHLPAVCSYYAAGHCRKGQHCDFIHENSRKGRDNRFPGAKVSGKVTPPSDDEFPQPDGNVPPSTKAGFRFLRVPSTFDNLSSKFRFSVPSPTTDQIFYSSDSDWCESVEGEDRLGSCTLALYTCSRCKEQVLAQEGEERITCPECDKEQLKEGGAGGKEAVHDQQDKKKNVKKKKKRKKKVPPAAPSHIFWTEPELYETPEGVKIYRVKEEQLKVEEINDPSANQADSDSEDCFDEKDDDGVQLAESDSDLDPEPVLNMKQGDNLNSEQDLNDGYCREESGNTKVPPESQSSPKTSKRSNSESLLVSDQTEMPKTYSNKTGASNSSKLNPPPKKSRNKTQRKRNKRQYRKQEYPEPFEPETFDEPTTPLSVTVISFLLTYLDLIPGLSSCCLSYIVWIVEKIMLLFCLCMAVALFVLRLGVVLVVNMTYISYQLVGKLISPFCFYLRPICFYLLHPTLLHLPGHIVRLCHQVLKQCLFAQGEEDNQAVPLLQMDRCRERGVREQFTSTESRLHFMAGVRSDVEKEAEQQFSEGLEIEPDCARLLSARARARYSQHKLCLALEDLARLERSTVEDLVVGAKCYLALGMLDMAHQIVETVKDSDFVNPSEVRELKKQLVIEESLANLPDQTQVEVLVKLVEQQTASSLRYQVRLVELTGDVRLMEELMARLMGGKGEQEAYSMYLTALVLYHTGHLARAEEMFLSCRSPCRVARCKYLAQLANVTRERLELAEHCLTWGRVEQGEELFRLSGEIDLSNQGVANISKLGLAGCSLVKGDTTTSLAICQELLTCQLDREMMGRVVVVKAGTLYKLGRYQDVINLVLSLSNYSDNKDLVSLLDKAREELDQVKMKQDDGSYYDLLGLDRSAGEGEIKTAFKRLARENHPDKFVEAAAKAKQEEIMKEINQAYTTLSDDMTRAEYDVMMENRNTEDHSMEEEEMVKVFEELFREVQQAANDWAQKQAMKGRKVNNTTLNLFISDHLLNNREYFTTKYKLQNEVFQALSDNFKLGGAGTGGKKRTRRRR
eukprot:GFUD01001418.1.p1 GENE.GFUD01001418.1~~GFUD01001418.1.p1  ORF type:complete len:1043 (+),score=396.25 GFUD01001418.1:88-3216(+)